MTEDLKAELKANEWPIRKPEDKPANPRGSFKWVSILISGGQLAQYLQYCAGGRTIATFPHDAGRGLWLEVNRLLKGTANDIGKSTADLWAFHIKESVTLPEKDKEIKALLELFLKAYRLVAYRKRNTITHKQQASLEKQSEEVSYVLRCWDETIEEAEHQKEHIKEWEHTFEVEKTAQADALKDSNSITPRSRQAVKLTEEGLVIEKSVRKLLRQAKAKKWVQDYSEEDVEDLISEAWLIDHDDKVIHEELDKSGLEWTTENIELAHTLITQHALVDGKPSVMGGRKAVSRWIDDQKLRDDASLSEIIGESEEGEGLERIETLVPTTAVTDKYGVIKNNVCTPEQAVLENDFVGYNDKHTERLRKVTAALTRAEWEWLATYENPMPVIGEVIKRRPHTAAERQRAIRLRSKAKRRVEGPRNGKSTSIEVGK
jgi:hypothetical protein